MTEFEQQVAEALRSIPPKNYGSYMAFLQESEGERREWWIAQLAPRVAAAIGAVVREHRGNVVAAEWPGLQASCYQAALAALRGDHD